MKKNYSKPTILKAVVRLQAVTAEAATTGIATPV